MISLCGFATKLGNGSLVSDQSSLYGRADELTSPSIILAPCGFFMRFRSRIRLQYYWQAVTHLRPASAVTGRADETAQTRQPQPTFRSHL